MAIQLRPPNWGDIVERARQLEPEDRSRALVKATRIAPLSATPAPDVPVNATFGAKLIQRFRELFQGESNWMSPGEPIAPIQPESQPRQRQVTVGSNLIAQPRASEATPFEQLGYFATTYDVAAICIRKRIKQVLGLEWAIVSREDTDGTKYASAIKDAKAFFRKPDRKWHWQQWLGALLYDRLCYDAATLYPRPTKGGQLYSLELISGVSIKPLVDLRGRIPDFPAPAFQQILWGLPRGMFDERQILYRPQNVRTSTPYGMSEIELILFVVNMALRKRIFDLTHFTEGNIPRALMAVPNSWSADQISEWQDLWDARMAGELARRSRMQFVPASGDQGRLSIFETAPWTGDPAFDTWLLKLTCAAFDITPAEIGFTDDVNRATSSGQEDVTYRTAIKPLCNWVESVLDDVLADYMGYPDLTFRFTLDETEDVLKVAQTNQIYWAIGAKQIDEIREKDLGLPALGIPPIIQLGGQPYGVLQAKQLVSDTRTAAVTTDGGNGDSPKPGPDGTPTNGPDGGGKPSGGDGGDTNAAADSGDGDSDTTQKIAKTDAVGGFWREVNGHPVHFDGDDPSGNSAPKHISRVEDLGLELTGYKKIGGGENGVYEGGGADLEPKDGFLYHGAPADVADQIKEKGLRAGRKSDPNKWEDDQNYFRGHLFAYRDPHDFGNVVDNAYNPPASGYNLYRFPDNGKWKQGIEGDLFQPGGRVKPKDLEILTHNGWRPLVSETEPSASKAAAAIEVPIRSPAPPPDPTRALRFQLAREDLRKWRQSSLKALKSGNGPRAFHSDYIPPRLAAVIDYEMGELVRVAGHERAAIVRSVFAKAVETVTLAEQA